MRLLYHAILAILFITSSLSLVAANRHLQTTANPTSGIIKVKIYDKEFAVNLNTPSTTYTKYPSGKLSSLSFFIVSKYYEVSYYPHFNNNREAPYLTKEYSIINKQKVLDGPSYSFDPSGNLRTISNWSAGLLDGKQTLYDSQTHQILEECEYNRGFPINSWTTYYIGGVKSSEITFPESYEQWEKTIVPGVKSNKQTLYSMNYPHPKKLTKIWFYPNGSKRKEQSFEAYKKNDDMFIKETGKSTTYGPDGTIICTTDTPDGFGTENYTVKSLGTIYNQKTLWYDSKIFNTINSQYPGIERP